MKLPRIAAADLVAVLLLLLLAFLVVDRLAPAGSATTPDSLAYLESAHNIAQGHGITLVEHGFDDEPAYRPMTTWPPLYPLLLSTLAPAEPQDGPRAAARLSMLLLVALLLACFAFLRRYWSTTGAALGAAAIGLSSPSVSVYAYAWSETLLLPLLAGALLLAAIAVRGNVPRAGNAAHDAAHDAAAPANSTIATAIVGLALLLGLAFATRYAAWILGLLLPAVFLLAPGRPRRLPRPVLLAALAALALYGAIAVAVIARNYLLSGTASGSPRQDGIPLLQALGDLGHTLALYVERPQLWLALLLAALVTWLLYRRPPATSATPRPQAAILLAAGAALATVLALLAMSTLARFDSLDQRLLAPSLVVLLLAALAALPLAAAKRSLPATAACAVLVALLLVPGLFRVASAPTLWQQQGAPMIPRDQHTAFTNYTALDSRPRLQAALAAIAPAATTVYSDRPRVASFLTGLPARKLPAGKIDADWLQQLATRPDGVLLLMQRGREFAAHTVQQGLVVRHHPELARRGLILVPLDQSFDNEHARDGSQPQAPSRP